jgi:hypothetical protein
MKVLKSSRYQPSMGKEKKQVPTAGFFLVKKFGKLQHCLKFLAKIPISWKKKSPKFGCFLECVATSLSSGYSFNDPVQKCFQLRRNLFESVW